MMASQPPPMAQADGRTQVVPVFHDRALAMRKRIAGIERGVVSQASLRSGVAGAVVIERDGEWSVPLMGSFEDRLEDVRARRRQYGRGRVIREGEPFEFPG